MMLVIDSSNQQAQLVSLDLGPVMSQMFRQRLSSSEIFTLTPFFSFCLAGNLILPTSAAPSNRTPSNRQHGNKGNGTGLPRARTV
jgi:hypothetical protein